MKLFKVFSLALSLTFIAFSANAQTAFDGIVLKDLSGQDVVLSDYAKNGKITVISMWATWCKPCVKELDAITDFYPDWQEEYDVELLAITIDTRRALAKVPPLVSSKGWEYTVLSDVNSEIPQKFNFQGVPYMFIIDQEGKIVYEHSGYVPGDEYELEKKLAKLAEGKK